MGGCGTVPPARAKEKAMRSISWGLAALAALAPAAAVAAPAPPIPAPPGVVALAGLACPPAPEPVVSLANQTAYRAGDASFSRIDPQRAAVRAVMLGGVPDFTRGLSRLANAYVASRGRDAARGGCALAWLDQWGRAGAMRDMATHDAQFVRAVNLAGWALAYAQLARLRVTGDDPHPRIQAWFAAMAADMRAHWQEQPPQNVVARNNHRYWAGLAATVIGIETGDRGLRDWGIASARIGLDQVTAEGALPLEIARAARARHYLLYAAAPLVMTAELAASQGIDLYGYRSGALPRLARFATAALIDPARVTALAGTAPEPFVNGRGQFNGQYVAWYEFFTRRFPGDPAARLILAHRPLVNPEIGGDISLLAGY